MVRIRQEDKYSPKYVLSTSEDEWGHTDSAQLLSPLEGIPVHEVHSSHNIKTAKVYAYLEKKEKKINHFKM